MTKRLDSGWLIFGCGLDWIVVSVMYHSLLFRCLPGQSFQDSRICLLWMSVVLFGAGVLLFGILMGKTDEGTALLVVLFPYGLYSFGAYRADFPLLFQGAAGGALALGALYTVLRLVQTLRHRRPLGVLVKRCGFCLYLSFCLLSSALALCLLFLGIRAVFFNSLVPSPVKAQVSAAAARRDLESHKDDLALLDPDRWASLSLQEKLGVLQVVINIESSYLGIPVELSASCMNLDENVLSAYDSSRKTVLFDLDSLARDSSAELIDSALHEVRHAYQYALLDVYTEIDPAYRDLLMFQDLPALMEEFSNYQDRGLEYYSQVSEQDARLYAQETAQLYTDQAEPGPSSRPQVFAAFAPGARAVSYIGNHCVPQVSAAFTPGARAVSYNQNHCVPQAEPARQSLDHLAPG